MYLCKYGQNPSTGPKYSTRTFQSASVTLRIRTRSPKILLSLTLLPIMYLGKFGQNPSTGSEDNAWQPYVGHLKCHVTLKIRQRSPNSNKLFSSSQQCIYASLVKIHPLVQKIMHGNESGCRRQHRWDTHQKQYWEAIRSANGM